MNKCFPRYLDFSPKVPVWCITPDNRGCIHRFFDTSPISPSGRYLAVFQTPFENRLPQPGDVGRVCLVDLKTGKFKVVGETRGWEQQLGANVNWGASDHELFFNDVDTRDWQPFAWKVDPLTGERHRMKGTVYHASPDGRWLLSANLTTMSKTQLGYGVCIPEENVRQNIGPSQVDGFYLTDTNTGNVKLLVSIADLLLYSSPQIEIHNPEQQEIYGFHCKFNPQGNRVMLSLRWFPVANEPGKNMFKVNFSSVRFAWVTMGLDKDGAIHCAVGPEQWKKGGHHATWFPDGKRISMNLNIDKRGMRFAAVNFDGENLHKMLPSVIGTGHPTIYNDGRYLLTDTYTWGDLSIGDGTVPLRWIDLQTGQEETIIRINTRQPIKDNRMRVDPHPAWDRTWRYVTFNAFVGGTRRVFIADMSELISHRGVLAS